MPVYPLNNFKKRAIAQGLLVFSMTLLLFITAVFSQSLSNQRTQHIPVGKDSVVFDTLSIVPNSFYILGIDSNDYKIDYVRARLQWIKKPLLQEVQIHYRVFPVALSREARHISFDSILNRFMISQEKISPRGTAGSPFDFGKLKSNGSLGRSLSFGNRQDAVLNSSLNLQLSGYIGDSIFLSAAISDNNIPIQPDGNTQNLNEFDQVFIQFSKDKWKFTIGDLDIRQNELYFLNFYKRLQGAVFENTYKLNAQMQNKVLASAAVAKGKFTRNIFQGIEGNQGPYRLKGANQELFFIVLAGTERIFIDGVMMQRGEDQDYVINYNTAEVTFTPRQMITKDKRIQIEFEYADRNFLNTQVFLQDKLEVSKRLKISVGYFGNGDAKNSPVNQTLSASQKQYLSEIGDNYQNAFYSSAFRDTSTANKIRYVKKDTTDALGSRKSVYVFENKDLPDLYTLSFTDFGEQGGDYIIDLSMASNGKVFKWVSPDPVTGKKNGRFEPLVLLVTPKKQRLLSVGSVLQLNATTDMVADFAVSTYDVNAFSSKDKSNDDGYAGRMKLKNVLLLKKKKELMLHTEFSTELATKSFKAVERLRSVEFTRDWGLDILTESADEKLVGLSMSLQDKSAHRLGYTFGSYFRNKDFSAIRHDVEHGFGHKGWRLNNRFVLTSLQDQIREGYFLRPVLDLSKRFLNWKNSELGIKYALERTLNRFKSWDSITANSFSFSTTQVYFSSDPSRLNKWGISYFTRSDQLPFKNQLLLTDRSHNYNLNTELMSNAHHQFRLNATYRVLDVLRDAGGVKNENTLLGRAEYFSHVWKGAIAGNMLYELGTGQEPRKEFTFFEVPAGQGEYTWIDYNSDGIQQVNEFEIAKFRDQAKYLRIFTPTNEFIRSNYVQTNYNVVLNPSLAIPKSVKGLTRNLIRRMYLQSSLQMGQKQLASIQRKFNPFSSGITDTSFISFDQIQSHTFSFNKFSQYWGIDLNYLLSSNRAFLSYGYETRRLKDLSLKIRANLMKMFTLEWMLKRNNNILETPRFGNRNFDIDALVMEPRLSYTMGTVLRLSSGFKVDDRINNKTEKAKIHSFHLEGKLSRVSKASIGSKLTYSKIDFNGSPSSTVGYIMLDGLLPGRNFIWTVDLTKRLGSFLEMTIQYEGRKSGSAGMVNIGRAQIRAIL